MAANRGGCHAPHTGCDSVENSSRGVVEVGGLGLRGSVVVVY